MDNVISTFEELDLTEDVMKAVKKMGFPAPTPIQAQTIGPMMEGYDIIAKAPTGTGKTCAFGIPLLECLRMDEQGTQALVLCPTRELCLQIAEELRSLAAFLPEVRIVAIYGGQPIPKQLAALKKTPQIVVATPGRLLDHMGRGTVSLTNIYTAVLDEADEMLKMGFIKDVRRILNGTPGDTQVVLFSATISRDVMDVAWQYQHDALEITVEAEGNNRPQITQYSIDAPYGKRIEDIEKLIDTMELKRVMIFCNMKNTVRRVYEKLHKAGRSVEYLNGDLSQGQRNQVMTGYRSGKFEILVATDVAARGIDVDDVEAVFNYDIPEENEYYLHRIGRTGRAKRHGIAVTFTTADDKFRMRDIKKYTHSDITAVTLADDGTLQMQADE